MGDSDSGSRHVCKLSLAISDTRLPLSASVCQWETGNRHRLYLLVSALGTGQQKWGNFCSLSQISPTNQHFLHPATAKHSVNAEAGESQGPWAKPCLGHARVAVMTWAYTLRVPFQPWREGSALSSQPRCLSSERFGGWLESAQQAVAEPRPEP